MAGLPPRRGVRLVAAVRVLCVVFVLSVVSAACTVKEVTYLPAPTTVPTVEPAAGPTVRPGQNLPSTHEGEYSERRVPQSYYYHFVGWRCADLDRELSALRLEHPELFPTSYYGNLSYRMTTVRCSP